MKIFTMILAFLICVLTLGILDVEIHYTDGSTFKWKSWLRLFWR